MANDVEVTSDKQEWFFGLDGDNMGHTVEDALIDNDIAKSQKFEKQIKSAFAEIEEYIVSELGGKVVFSGGDNVLFTADGDPEDIGEHIRDLYKSHTDHSATVGVGHLPVEAHKALVVGKNTGKDQIVVWGEEAEKTYAEIQEQQKALEDCEAEVREDSDLEVGTSSALKYRAEAHYRRLIGLGYDPQVAEDFVVGYYAKEAAQYRDVLRKKNPLTGTTPVEAYLREGEQRYAAMIDMLESPAPDEMDSMPVLGQKFVSDRGIGIIRFVGSRFVSIEWLDAHKERVALRNFRACVENNEYHLVPKIRVGKKRA